MFPNCRFCEGNIMKKIYAINVSGRSSMAKIGEMNLVDHNAKLTDIESI
jgi:hypothetical protein